jgi:hypothetical protein
MGATKRRAFGDRTPSEMGQITPIAVSPLRKNLCRRRDQVKVKVMETPRCRTCHGAASSGLRRGLCRACYLRAWRGTELPAGAACALCPEKRRVVLRWTRVGSAKLVTCQNCGFITDRLRPRPRTLDDLKERLARERRLQSRRRDFVIEPLDPSERRVAARRVRRRVPV